jgi:protein-S-isoprenylcysteine O-methyltransferase Ste14
MTQAPWWKGARGEWYVVAQFALFGLIALAPLVPGQPAWPAPWSLEARVAGLLLGLAGLMLAMAGLFGLGANLSVLPRPKDDASLVQGGAYGLVRHPIYAGLIQGACGWGLLSNSWLALAGALALVLLFDLKARREEAWLAARFPGYRDYQRRVRKFLPFIY